MKNYLLKPHKRHIINKDNVWLITGGIRECWRLIKDKYFLCIHFKYDHQSLIKTVDPATDLKDADSVNKFIFESDICLGILTKRGNASVKSMLKVYKIEKDYENYLAKINKGNNSKKNEDDDDLDYDSDEGPIT